jgi:hypothetical protein
METIRKQNPLVRVALIAAVLAVFAWSYFQEKKPKMETGTLEYRMVTGYKSGILQLIMMEVEDSYIIPDTAFRKDFEGSQEELVSRPLQLKMMETFENIEYRVGFNEETGEKAKPTYRVTREMFNSVKFGKAQKYEVNKKQKDAIVRLVD